MRKFLTLALLLVTVLSAKSATDVITTADFLAKYGKTAPISFTSATISNGSEINSGAEYEINKKMSKTGSGDAWYVSATPALLTCTKSGGNIKSLTINLRTSGSDGAPITSYYLNRVAVFVSDQPITASNYTSAKKISLDSSTKNKKPFLQWEVTVPEGDYKYAALWINYNYWYFGEVSFTWAGGEDTQAQKPEITAPGELKFGNSFTFVNKTEGATISYEYGIFDAAQETPTYTSGSGTGTSFTIPEAAAGKWLYISATAGGTGFTTSEVATWGGQIEALPTVGTPVISAPNPLKAGQSFSYTSDTPDASFVTYFRIYDNKLTGTATPSYNDSAEGATFTIPDEAAGKWLYTMVVATKNGYNQSSATWSGEILSNSVAETPTVMVPNPVKAGAQFGFTTTSAGADIYYKVIAADAEVETPSFEGVSEVKGDSYTVTYTDADKYLYFSVVARDNGFDQSETAVFGPYKVEANPAAAAPEIIAPKELKVGQIFTFTSTQEVTISYKYAVSDTETAEPAYGEAAEGTEFTIPAEANGKWLYISATANGEKYTESLAATWGKQITKTAEPVSIGYDVFNSTTVSAQGQDVEITGSTTGLNYTGYFGNFGDKYGVGAYDKQAALANTDSKVGLYVEYVEYSSDLYQYFASNKANVYVANEPITLANYESVATFVKTLTANPLDLRADIEGNYSYVAIVSGGTGKNPLAASYINIGWKQVPAESNVAATPEFKNDLPNPLRAGTTLELISATEGAKISYKVVYTDTADEVVDFDAITATEAQTAPVSFTIPDDAAQKHMRLWAQATADGFEASEPFITTAYVDFPTGVIGIEAEESEAEYYTLQGVRVANPEKGIYVRVANGKAAKVVL